MDTATIGHNSELAVYSEFRQQLGKMRKANEEAKFDYEDSRGNKEARSHVYKLRQTKSAVEEARKKAKAESLEYGRRVDAQANEIKSAIDAMIEVHAKPLEAIEQRERDRVARHEANLSEIVEAGRVTAEQWTTIALGAMKDRLAEVEAEPIGESRWEEFALRAAQAKEAAVRQMRDAIASRERHDAEQAELARLREEAEARKKAEHEERIRQEATKRAAEEAEKKAHREREEAAAAAAREREAGERRELELKLAAERAEREKAEAEQRAVNAAKEAEARLAREAEEKAAAEAAELAKREANKKHRAGINNTAVRAMVKHGISEDVAKQAITLIAQKVIPNVSISY